MIGCGRSEPVIVAGEHLQVGRPTSRIALGISSFGTADRAFPVYDGFWNAGGNFFDSAWIYGQSFEPGCCERVLGRWLETRGVRDHVTVLAKGAHTPKCSPGFVEPELRESLELLRTSYADVYMLHRDRPEVPVGEFVDALVRLVDAGLAKQYGFSNWTHERLREALAYAADNQLPGPVAISNQFSLVAMNTPVFEGCVCSRDRSFSSWLAANGIVAVPWSSQGRGYFVNDGILSEPPSGSMVSNWYSKVNAERARRARVLAGQLEVEPVNVALAWVLHQAFIAYPIIGPRKPEELASSLRGCDVRLTDQQVRWLAVDD